MQQYLLWEEMILLNHKPWKIFELKTMLAFLNNFLATVTTYVVQISGNTCPYGEELFNVQQLKQLLPSIITYQWYGITLWWSIKENRYFIGYICSVWTKRVAMAQYFFSGHDRPNHNTFTEVSAGELTKYYCFRNLIQHSGNLQTFDKEPEPISQWMQTRNLMFKNRKMCNHRIWQRNEVRIQLFKWENHKDTKPTPPAIIHSKRYQIYYHVIRKSCYS